ncbi:uncharacterized protein A4U43_C07F39420 [Asparagus officinalis]|uniref:NADPH:adrenodoxin oxidoreductase, mitochondrial n=1 Tax=Asparagus officinalis TaxID=4686 RepID=A0A5P1EI95_ASPOF|nr:uncharacterized protein A4U43_C07F39420 [Asparagus officinalis]
MRRLLFHHARNLLSSTKDLSSLQSLRLLHVCIIGSGPAGFYTAEKMLKADDKVEIDILDRLPTPFGLVRSGVAPDHPETKIVVNQFTRVATNERCSFYGNVSLGNSVSLPELRQIYDIVVLAYGAESDRSLGVLGEDLRGIYSAREFVWWYNGHPDCYNLEPDLKHTDTAVIFGQVALEPLKVYLVGRRGPAQAACTTKELREILGIKNVNVHIQEADLVKSPADEEGLKNTRIQRRVYELFAKAATSAPHPAVDQRELHFVFFRKPERFLSSDGCNVSGVRLEKTCLKENGGSGRQVAVGTGEFENLNCGLVLKSIGYKSLPVNGLPFDSQRGIVPNVKGRVVSSNQTEHEKVEHGLYVVGWLKRGPTGIIGTNLYCAAETVMSILEDVHKGEYVQSSKPGREGLLHLLKDKNLRFVPFGGWEKIDCKEKMKGQLQNRPRDKITSWEELLKAANE